MGKFAFQLILFPPYLMREVSVEFYTYCSKIVAFFLSFCCYWYWFLSSFLFTGVEQQYAGVPMSILVEQGYGVGDVVSLLWFKRSLPHYCSRFIEVIHNLSIHLVVNLLNFRDLSISSAIVIVFLKLDLVVCGWLDLTDLHHDVCWSWSLCFWCPQLDRDC